MGIEPGGIARCRTTVESVLNIRDPLLNLFEPLHGLSEADRSRFTSLNRSTLCFLDSLSDTPEKSSKANTHTTCRRLRPLNFHIYTVGYTPEAELRPRAVTKLGKFESIQRV